VDPYGPGAPVWVCIASNIWYDPVAGIGTGPSEIFPIPAKRVANPRRDRHDVGLTAVGGWNRFLFGCRVRPRARAVFRDPSSTE